jgi:hypothetical protein
MGCVHVMCACDVCGNSSCRLAESPMSCRQSRQTKLEEEVRMQREEQRLIDLKLEQKGMSVSASRG